jgi:HPt (histidine-containing phosphotransfer) domain-containing protein
VDVTTALKRLAGNGRLYRNLLQRFVEGQESCASEIGKALEQGDADQALTLAHKLNGISGNLGVDAVQTAAAELEKQLRVKNSAESIKQTHVRLDAALRAAVDAIRSMLQQENAVPGAEGTGRAAGDLKAPLEKLSRLIEENDSEALEVFESLRTTWEATAGREETKKLADLLSAYDFTAALPHVKRFEQKIRASMDAGEADVGHE